MRTPQLVEAVDMALLSNKNMQAVRASIVKEVPGRASGLRHQCLGV
jgi:hypothetical protein